MLNGKRLDRARAFLGPDVDVIAALDAHRGAGPVFRACMLAGFVALSLLLDMTVVRVVVLFALFAGAITLTRRDYLIAATEDSVHILGYRPVSTRLDGSERSQPRPGAIGEPSEPRLGSARVEIAGEEYWVAGSSLETTHWLRSFEPS